MLTANTTAALPQKPLVSVGDLAWDVLAKPDTLLLPGGDTTGRMELSPGGSAANLAVWARRLGYPSTFIGKIGTGHFGALAQAGLVDEGVDAQVIRTPDHPTGVILALIDRHGQRAMLTGQGADWELLPEELPPETLLSAGHVHLTAWSLFRDPPRSAALKAAKLAEQAGATLSLDPGSFQMIQQAGREHFLDWISEVPFDIFFPNADEARAMSGEATPEASMTWLRGNYPNALMVLKMDEDGALLEGPHTPRSHVPASHDTLVDATGAGDAFGGGFLAHYLRHGDPIRAAQVAAQVGGWVVSRFGARPPVDEALLARLRPFGLSNDNLTDGSLADGLTQNAAVVGA